jgi:DNA primase
VGLIPRPFLDDLLSQTDIVSFIDGYVSLKKQGVNFVACCPFHQEKTPSFNVITKKQFYHCFGCGVSGNAISFAMSYLNQDFSEAVETLAARAGLQVPREGNSQHKAPGLNLYQLLNQVAQFYQKALKIGDKAALQYIENRGVHGDVIERYQLGYAPPGWHTLESVASFKSNQADLITTGMLIKKDKGTYDRYRHRLMFPIHDKQGRIIGFGGRSLDDTQKPKYLNSPETVIFHKNRELYGLHQVLQLDSKPSYILVVEGYMDVIALAQMGITNAVAALGTATNTYHIQLLSKHTTHIVFCFDGDAAGQQAAWRALESTLPTLDTTVNASFIFLPKEHDPDSYIREHGTALFSQLIQTAMPLHQFFFNTLLQGIDSTTVAGKNQIIHKAKPYLNKIPESPFKALCLEELVKLTHLDLHRVNHLMLEHDNNKSMHMTIIKRTPARVATALLLQHPDVYATLIKTAPPIILAENHTILNQIMQHIAKNPTINTASLVELFRDTPLFEPLNKLAAWDHLVPQHALIKELLDTLQFLAKKEDEQEIQTLIQRAKTHSLDKNEQQRLQRLLQLKKAIKISE